MNAPILSEPGRRIVDDLLATTHGTKFTRALPPYGRKVFAICLCACKREQLAAEMRQMAKLTWQGDPGPVTTLTVRGALIGTWTGAAS